MSMKKQRAAALTTAQKNNQPHTQYSTPTPLLRRKLQLGTLLLALQTSLSRRQQGNYWELFESTLRQYVDLKYCEVTP